MADGNMGVIESIGRFTRQSQAKFMKLLGVHTSRVKQKFAGMYLEVQSDGPVEQYPAMGATPQLKAYDEGEVPGQTIDTFQQRVTNRQFGMSVSVGRNFFSDIDRMPGAKQMLMMKVSGGLSKRAANFVNKLFADMLLQNAPYSSMTAYDGYALFHASHPGGTNIISPTTAGGYTMADIQDDHNNLLDKMAARKDPDQQDYVDEEAPSKILYLVPPIRLASYATFFRSASIPGIVKNAAGSDNVAASGVDNVASQRVSGIDGLGNQVDVIGWARLRGQTKVYSVDMSDSEDGIPALLHQVREAPTLEFLGPSENNPNYVLGERLTWKIRMRGEVGIGEPLKVFRIDKT